MRLGISTNKDVVYIGHREDGLAVRFVDLMDGANVGVIEGSSGFGFSNEAQTVRPKPSSGAGS